ncbi:MAG TPA: hypothetical protein VFJ72_00505 [Rubrobacteraceae bacterium]|nr:hypothetical protein [Rubrobacteraceae bacterium]
MVDSMQVYREIPTITNQRRQRPAEMVGVASVLDEWTVARHRDMSLGILAGIDIPFVLDAGTGMYLNALLLEIELSPKVEPHIRAVAESLSQGDVNPRRASRERELRLAGAPERSSIWDANLRYETTLIYIRPDRESLDKNIQRRANHIIQNAIAESETIAALISRGATLSPQVSGAIGVKEMLDLVAGSLTGAEAESRIAARTRRLARRQIRWFDKLTRTISDRAAVEVVSHSSDAETMHTLHDTIGS